MNAAASKRFVSPKKRELPFMRWHERQRFDRLFSARSSGWLFAVLLFELIESKESKADGDEGGEQD